MYKVLTNLSGAPLSASLSGSLPVSQLNSTQCSCSVSAHKQPQVTVCKIEKEVRHQHPELPTAARCSPPSRITQRSTREQVHFWECMCTLSGAPTVTEPLGTPLLALGGKPHVQINHSIKLWKSKCREITSVILLQLLLLRQFH